ncbi:hypothetical protein SEA_RASPUTIA_134 [Microbacterium phage Rasputia]|nr:hypothetical protein SEA_RASPUTIA_134 [Microbacterium phage Rasputia]
MTVRKASAASLIPGNVIVLEETEYSKSRVVTVDSTKRMPFGIVRIFHSLYGLQHIDAAGAHRFELRETS